MKLASNRLTALAALLVAVTALAGCAETLRARGVEQSGFLGEDYALLRPGVGEQAQERYVRSGVKWSAYRRILLDPVTVWKGKESTGKGVSATDEQLLVDYFYSVIHSALAKEHFTMVRVPQPDTLRVKVAITKLHESNVALNVVSTVVPQLILASSLEQLATGKPAFVGEAQIEVKITDAMTGQLLAAVIDHRVGGKNLDAAMMQTWGDVETIMRLWAMHGSYNLCRMQNRPNCVAPPKPS